MENKNKLNTASILWEHLATERADKIILHKFLMKQGERIKKMLVTYSGFECFFKELIKDNTFDSSGNVDTHTLRYKNFGFFLEYDFLKEGVKSYVNKELSKINNKTLKLNL